MVQEWHRIRSKLGVEWNGIGMGRDLRWNSRRQTVTSYSMSHSNKSDVVCLNNAIMV